MNKSTVAILCAVALATAACGKKDDQPRPGTAAAPPASQTTPPAASPPPMSTAPAAVTVSNITVGNAIGSDRKVTASPARLGKNDTIYVSVDTTGSGNADVRAKWTYVQGGQSTLVNEEAQRINAVGPATTEFHVSKPDGWPAGEYQVEIFVNEISAGTRRFTVG